MLNGKSPYEALFKQEPKIKHLRIFGCDAYPLILGANQDKFGARAKKNCIMIGYGEKEGIYWILDKVTRKTFRSRDVRFNENELLNEKLNDSNLLIDTNEILPEVIKNEDHEENQHDEVENGNNLVNDGKAQIGLNEQDKDKNNSTDSSDEDVGENEFVPGFENAHQSSSDSISSTGAENLLKEIRKSSRPKQQTQKYVSGESETEKKKKVHFSMVMINEKMNQNLFKKL